MRSNVIIFLVLISLLAKGQEPDSLLDQYKAYPNDTSKVKLLYNRSFAFRNTDLPSAIKFAQACYSAAVLSKNDHFIGKALNLKATLKADMGMNKEAAVDFMKALQLFIQTRDTLSQAIILNNLGNVYGSVNEDVKAFTCFENSLRLATLIENDQWVNSSILGIASLQVKDKNFSRAINNLETVLKFAETNSDHDLLLECYKNIGLCKLNLGDTLAAESYQLMVLDLTEMMEDSLGHADAYNSLGEICLSKRNFAEAFSCFQNALNLSQKNNYNEGLLSAWKGLATCYKEMKKDGEAYFYLAKHDSAVDQNGHAVVEDFSSLWNVDTQNEVEASAFTVRNVFQLLLIGAVILILVFVLKQNGNEQKGQEV